MAGETIISRNICGGKKKLKVRIKIKSVFTLAT